jgi:hypothetical protein
MSLSFGYPYPPPPRSCKISRINDLPFLTVKIPRKIFITNNLQVKILKAWDLRPISGLELAIEIAACAASAGTMMEQIGGGAQGQMSQGWAVENFGAILVREE